MADNVTTIAAERPHDDEMEFLGWMQCYLDESLLPVQAAQLNARLRAHQRWRTMFARCLMQATFLEEQMAQERASNGLESTASRGDGSSQRYGYVLARLREFGRRKKRVHRSPTRRERKDPRSSDVRSMLAAAMAEHRRVVYVVGTLAAAVLLLAVVWLNNGKRQAAAPSKRPAEFIAKLVDSQGCQWSTGDELSKLQMLPPGRELTLIEGVAEVQFGYGARAVIEGPARFEVDDAQRMTLWEGSAVFQVPESAVGFIVDTISLRLIDLGTEFGLRTTATGKAALYVFQGKIRVDAATGRDSTIDLIAGQAAITSPTGKGTFSLCDKAQVKPESFRRSLVK